MEIPVSLQETEGQSLIIKTSFWKAPRLYLDGVEVPGKRLNYSIRNSQGKEVAVKLKFNFFDAIPKLEVEGQAVELAPPLKWYEYAWIWLPIALLFIGGAIGGLLGYLAVYTNTRIFRSQKGMFLKYLFSGLVSVTALVTFLVIATLIYAFIGR
ncbi:MAG: hypothetical protein JW869_05810 [Candidatus Omnitrophica bacterium]|nr:hypothetical protein [Candidatus Omnitrophota bacterium]